MWWPYSGWSPYGKTETGLPSAAQTVLKLTPAAITRAITSKAPGPADLIWERCRPPPRPAPPRTWAEVPAQTAETAALSKALKPRGFRFVGHATLYALMQACGDVDVH